MSLTGEEVIGAMMHSQENDFRICKQHLAKVSRTFALNIRVLKGDVYRGLLLAYLLCRIADTFEDDPSLPPPRKIRYLSDYAELFPPSFRWRARTDEFVRTLSFGTVNSDSLLAGDMQRVFGEFVKLPPPYIAIISGHVREMALGMADFQKKFSTGGIICLDDEEELNRYCYYVAGTVGLMITAIFSQGARSISKELQEKLKSRSVSFGVGLQLTNIAKDFFSDFKRGWCYVPRSFFFAEGISPDFDVSELNRDAYWGLFRRLIHLALENLDSALNYTLDIPRTLVRYRLFCLWPLFMAIETLAKLNEKKESLFRGQAIKISRGDVRRVLCTTSLFVMSNGGIRAIYDRTRRNADLLFPAAVV